MKTLKVKSILFTLLAIMAVAVFMTSCEQEIIGDETDGFLIAEDNSEITTYDVTNLPTDLPSPEEVLEWSLNESTDVEQDTDLRGGICGCSRVVRYKTNGSSHTVDWYSQNNLALFVYHYKRSNNKYLGYTRINPTTSSCHFRCKGFYFNPSGNNGAMKSVAFLGSGYTTCSSKTSYWTDN